MSLEREKIQNFKLIHLRKLIGEELTKKIKQGLHYILKTCQEDFVEKLVNMSL